MAPREVPEGVRERVRKRSRKWSQEWMDSERLDPQKQSCRLHAVRSVEKRGITEGVAKIIENESQNGLQNHSFWRHWHLQVGQGSTLPPPGVDCEVYQEWVDFWRVAGAVKSRWSLALGRPRGDKNAPAGRYPASIALLGSWLPKAGLARARNR